MRSFLAFVLLLATAVPAVAQTAERIAAELTRTAEGEDPYRALGDLLLEWDERTGGLTVQTFVRDPDAAERRHAAIFSGDCGIVRAMERSAFLNRFPHLRPVAESPKYGALLEAAIFLSADDRGVCEANAAIAEAVATLGDDLRLTFPLLSQPDVEGMAWLPRMKSGDGPVDAIARALGRLHVAAICQGDVAGLASLIGYTHAPKLIEFSPERAYFLLERARAHGFGTDAAGLASIRHDPANLPHETRERLAHLAEMPDVQLDPRLLPVWSRNCANPPSWQE